VSSVHVELYPFQAALLACKAAIVAAISGTGSGKSYTGSWRLLLWLLDGPRGARYGATAPTLGMLKANLWREFVMRLGEAGLVEDRDYTYNRTALEVTLTGRGTAVIGRTMDKPSTMQGSHLHGLVADEAGLYTPDAWHVIQQRCSLYHGQIFITSTPYSWNFLKTEIYDPWIEAGKAHETIEVFQISSLANPNFPRDEYDRAKKNLPKWKFDMFYNGRFTRPSGLVYAEFQIVQAPLVPVVRVFAGADYGHTNPSGIVWIADDGRGNHQVFRCWKKSHAGFELIAEQMKRERCRYYGDPAAAGVWDDMRRKGIMITAAKNDVNAGIGAVDAAFRSGRLTILEGGEGVGDLLDELASYSWQTDGSGEPIEKIEKTNDHLCDSLRYGFFTGAAGGQSPRVSHDNYILQSIRETARY
jgi:hypothetical protein